MKQNLNLLKTLNTSNKERPKEEVTQGEQLAFLSVVDRYLMAYVFFTPEQEEKIQKMADNISKKWFKSR